MTDSAEPLPWTPTPDDSPWHRLGGSESVLALAEAFYDAMEELEPALTATHERNADGRVSRRSRDRFGLFLIGWLGGPQDYIAQHGHPRLRARHSAVAIDSAMRDAWLRSMTTALDRRGVGGPVRPYLDARFADVANFLRNRTG